MKSELLNYIPDYKHGIDWNVVENSFFAPYVQRMKDTPQNPEWHGEGNVFNHTKMVVEALLSLEEYRLLAGKERQVLFLAALFHDIGKVVCTKEEDGVLRSYNHSFIGSLMTRELLWKEGLSGTKEKQEIRESVCTLIRFHSVPSKGSLAEEDYKRYIKIASFGKLAKYFSIKALCLLARADTIGRVSADKELHFENISYIELLATDLGIYDKPKEFSSSYTERGYFLGKTQLSGNLYDPTWGEVILLCGLPGTGKDYYVQKSGLPMVCLDEIRKEFKISATDNQGRVIVESKERARDFLRKKQPFIWNATCITEMIRAKHISLFEDYGARVKIVFLETSWETELERNKNRENAVPEYVIEGMLSKFEPPYSYEAQEVEWLIV